MNKFCKILYVKTINLGMVINSRIIAKTNQKISGEVDVGVMAVSDDVVAFACVRRNGCGRCLRIGRTKRMHAWGA